MTSIAKKFVRFASVGVFGTIAHYAVLIAIVEMLRLNAIFPPLNSLSLAIIHRFDTFTGKKACVDIRPRRLSEFV